VVFVVRFSTCAVNALVKISYASRFTWVPEFLYNNAIAAKQTAPTLNVIVYRLKYKPSIGIFIVLRNKLKMLNRLNPKMCITSKLLVTNK
jgi:hypothetical protein